MAWPPVELQLRLKRHVQVFLAEKSLIGSQGQPITDEVRVTIAAQACLLLGGAGQVILSWAEVLVGAADASDGRNVSRRR